MKSHSADLDALRSRYDVAVYEFDRGARRMPTRQAPSGDDAPPVRAPEATGGATALGTAALQVLDEHRGGALARLLVLSDVASNLGIAPAEAARECERAGTPVHAIAFGASRLLPDLAVESLEAPPRARVGVAFRIAARVRSSGLRRHEAGVMVRAARDGRDWEEVERTRVSFTPEGPSAEVRASFTPRSAGTFAVEVAVEAFAAEAVTVNNSRTTFVEVEESSVRALYIEGVLRPDFRAIRGALAGAGDFELDVVRGFLQSGSTNVEGGVPQGAADGLQELEEMRLAEYDVFVVGELPAGGHSSGNRGRHGARAESPSELRKIERLVREYGRGLVVFSGPEALEDSPLGAGLPVEITDPRPSPPKRVRPSAAGASHPALGLAGAGSRGAGMWSKLGPLADLPTAARVRRTGVPLLLAEGDVPVLVAARAGSGRVAVFLSGKTHVWKYDPRSPRGAYEHLVRSIAAWAAGRESSNALLSARLSRHALHPLDEVTLTARVNRARAREAGLTDGEIDRIELAATVTGPSGTGGAAETLRLQRRGHLHTGTVRARRAGVHRIVVRPSREDKRIGDARTAFVVAADPRELRRLAADPAALEALARRTGGLFARADDAGAVLGPLLRAPTGEVTFARRTRSLWDRAWVLLLFLGTLFSEWWMRRR